MQPDPEPEPEPGEHASIARWAAALPTEGIGDDVAWVQGFAVTVDTLVEEVHFRRTWATPQILGHRAATAGLSDLAASRARPVGLLVALSVAAFDAWADGVMAGIGEAAAEAGTTIVGGDTTGSPGPAVISITALGRAAPGGPLRRSGARPGDGVYLSGPLGASAAATAALLAGDEAAAWPRPRARLDLLPALADANAGIDVSDGLLADAGHVARASGVDLVIDRDRVRVPGIDESFSLAGGEDWELLVTSPVPLDGFFRIGAVEAAGGAGVVRFADGSPLPDRRGFDHGC